ncbi:MAG: hypothetical protein ACYC26_03770 [Phycisphaerales bacterium]
MVRDILHVATIGPHAESGVLVYRRPGLPARAGQGVHYRRRFTAIQERHLFVALEGAKNLPGFLPQINKCHFHADPS